MKFGIRFNTGHGLARWACSTLAVVATMGFPGLAHAQFGFGFNNFRGVVGGVSIDAEGVVRDAQLADQDAALRALRDMYKGAPKEMAKASSMRMVSLKGLQKEIAKAHAEGKQPAEDVLFMGGLTRIEYVFIYPELNDIVLAGPAENWIVSKSGSVVGQASGRPVLYLDDLLTAFRSVGAAQREAVSVSIDPTPEGIARLEALQKTVGARFNPGMESQFRDAFGPQMVRLTGVPSDSHMARVLLAADYQMKRYGMDLAEAPVKGLPSYLDMIRNTNGVPQSRWWMACDYSAVEHTKDSLAWRISGPGIKTMTEEEFIDNQGQRKGKGKVDGKAQKWADVFTSKLDELATKDSVFGELRNVMDLCVIAALVESKNLEQQAGCDLSVVRGKSEGFELAKLGTPKSLPAQCSFLKTSNGWIISTSGGVMVDSWSVVEKTKINDSLEEVRSKASHSSGRWYWN